MDRRGFVAGSALGLGTTPLAAPAGDGGAHAQGAAVGPRPLGGAITDVPGVKVGHFTDTRRPTGCTVVLTVEGATGGVDVRGAAPGTRETDLLDPSNLVDEIHAVLLSGGSAFGLDAAAGVVRPQPMRRCAQPLRWKQEECCHSTKRRPLQRWLCTAG